MYRFELRPSLRPEEIGRLRVLVGWDEALELYRRTLGTTYLWAGCFLEETLVGYVDVTSDAVQDAYIRDLIVDPAHQQQGIGSRLLAMVLAQIRHDGIRMANVVFERELAGFYRKAGFHLMAGGMLDFKFEGQTTEHPVHEMVVTVFAFVVEGNKLLLVRQKGGDRFWDLPGGVVEAGESVEQAVIREVKEETGYDIQVSGVVGIYSKPRDDALATLFKGQIVGGQRHVFDAEISDVGFFPIDAIPCPVRDHFHQRLADFCAGETSAFLRTQ